MSKMTLLDQIEMLRAQLETTLPIPFVLVVSSARDEDGKGLVASGLASSLDAAGYSTLLVLADQQSQDVDGFRAPKSLGDVCDLGIARYAFRSTRTNASVMVVPDNENHTISRETVTRFNLTCRASYQATIVEARTALTDSFAMLASVAADGVLLTIREGRRVYAEDRQLAKMLARDQAPFMGVVSVGASAIRDGITRGLPKSSARATSIPSTSVKASRKRQPV